MCHTANSREAVRTIFCRAKRNIPKERGMKYQTPLKVTAAAVLRTQVISEFGVIFFHSGGCHRDVFSAAPFPTLIFLLPLKWTIWNNGLLREEMNDLWKATLQDNNNNIAVRTPFGDNYLPFEHCTMMICEIVGCLYNHMNTRGHLDNFLMFVCLSRVYLKKQHQLVSNHVSNEQCQIVGQLCSLVGC